ncbi:glycosyltransferase [Citricoccus nitrophenolicus]
MLPLALMHNIRYSSDIVLDVPERPGMVTVSGSAASLFSKFERALLKISRPFVAETLVVTYADVDYMKSLGFESVRLVRNVPMSDWKAPYLPPPIAGQGDDNRKLRLIAMGSVFEGRAYEKLIKAVAIASAQIEIELTVCGPGRPGYLTDLRSLADDLRIGDRVNFIEPVSIEKVSAMYLSADIGMVLYESTDPGNDGLSNKLFECVASGRPVIASDLPENHRFVEENGAGWLAGDSVEDLARVIVSAAEPDSVQSKASHCRRIGDEVLSWETEFPLQFFNGREAPARAAGA